MRRIRRSRVEVFARWALALAVLAGCAVPGLAGEAADEPKPAPLPVIELTAPPAQPEGVPQAIEAGGKIREGDYEAALPLYRESWNKGVKSENSTYNAACAAAVTGHTDEAFVWLDRTAEAGFRDTAHLEFDSDLDSLRDDPRFAAFVKRAEANARQYDRENNAELRELEPRGALPPRGPRGQHRGIVVAAERRAPPLRKLSHE